MSTLNEITGVVEGEYGRVIVGQIVDDEGQPIDISSYTGTMEIKSLSPDHQTLLTFTGSFNTTGTDGKFKFTPSSSNTFTRDGLWESQVRLSATSILVMTVPFIIEVYKKI